jgi:YggT family protein
MGSFLFIVINGLFSAVLFVLVANAIVSWLVAFQVINTRNAFVYTVVRFLEAVSTPILAPFRRFIPPLGGVDVSPVIAILVIAAFQATLLRMIFAPIIGVLG